MYYYHQLPQSFGLPDGGEDGPATPVLVPSAGRETEYGRVGRDDDRDMMMTERTGPDANEKGENPG